MILDFVTYRQDREAVEREALDADDSYFEFHRPVDGEDEVAPIIETGV